MILTVIKRLVGRPWLVLVISLCLSSLSFAANDLNLPELGDSSSSIVSPQQEYQLGQAWLRMYRSQVPAASDPLLYDYLGQILDQLARSSDLKDQRLELILVNNPTMNAFAVPGGVVGVHTGLFLYSDSEDQLASVLAHELAHLSQRHFARSVEQRQRSSLPTMAALLASLVLAATVGGDAGIAAMTMTQAAALDSQLRFSRQNEQEADRIGMQTLAADNRNPEAAPEMFENMLRSIRYTQRPPEFLLTHPVTENRIADSRNRAAQYPQKFYPPKPYYLLMQARAKFLNEKSAQSGVQHFMAELDGESLSKEASRYGLVLALTKAQQLEEAQKHLDKLLAEDPNNLPYQLAQVDLLVAAGQFDQALTQLNNAQKARGTNYPIQIRTAEVLMRAGYYARSEELLENMSRQRPKDDYVWYMLAEVHGLAGNILGVHIARAEYFILNGIFDKAQIQLENALKLSQGNFHQTSLLQERLRYLTEIRDQKF